jgi:hypothetical protein
MRKAVEKFILRGMHIALNVIVNIQKWNDKKHEYKKAAPIQNERSG